MSIALQQAKKSFKACEVPVGAVIIKNDKIISMGYNKSISNFDPTSHAEINAIREAGKKIKNYRLTGLSIYVTLEPCAMCFGAIIHSRIENIFFGAYDHRTGVCASCTNLNDLKCFNHTPKIMGGILEKECSNILKDFFKSRRS